MCDTCLAHQEWQEAVEEFVESMKTAEEKPKCVNCGSPGKLILGLCDTCANSIYP